MNEVSLQTPFGEIAAKRLSTSLGQRREPVTYWFAVGDTAIKNRVHQRLIEIKLGLTGQIPDGLLFRVSSIDDSPVNAYAQQDAFIKELLGAVPASDRKRLSGLGSDGAGT